MAFAGELLENTQDFINTYGESVRFRKFTKTISAGSYDDEVLLTSGTNTWVSGLIQPIGKSEAELVRQGLLTTNDLKIYVDGSVNTSGLWRLGIGSANPPTGEYALISNNVVNSPMITGSVIYKKMFLRRLPSGSLFGE